jgi:hypothetical protein
VHPAHPPPQYHGPAPPAGREPPALAERQGNANYCNVYLRNLPPAVTGRQLALSLAHYGRVVKVSTTPTRPQHARCRFFNEEEADRCARELNGRALPAPGAGAQGWVEQMGAFATHASKLFIPPTEAAAGAEQKREEDCDAENDSTMTLFDASMAKVGPPMALATDAPKSSVDMALKVAEVQLGIDRLVAERQQLGCPQPQPEAPSRCAPMAAATCPPMEASR